MLLAAAPVRREYFSCIDGLLATMANYFSSPYGLMFIGYMGFEYLSDKPGADTFGEKLLYGVGRYSRDALHKYHHVKTSWCDAENYRSLHNTIVHSLLNQVPVGVYLDSFYCPWNLAYQRFHINHYVLVIGLDMGNEAYICLDPYASAGKYKLPGSCLQKGFREYILFEKDPSENQEPLSLCGILHENYYSNAYIGRFEKNYSAILQFADDLSHNIDIAHETSAWGGDLQSTLLFRRINNLGKNRTKFACALHYLGDVFESEAIHNIASAAEELHSGWDMINSLLFRLHLTGKESIKSTIYHRLAAVAEKEKQLSLALTEIAEESKEQTMRSEFLQRECIV